MLPPRPRCPGRHEGRRATDVAEGPNPLSSTGLYKHLARFPKIGERQAFGEPRMHWLQHNAGVGTSALRQPETGKTRARLQLEQLRRLVPRNVDRVPEFAFRGSDVGIRTGCQHHGLPAPDPGVECRDTRASRRQQCLIQQLDRLRRSAGQREHIRHQSIDVSRFPLPPERNQHRKGFRQCAQPVRDLTLPRGEPAQKALAKRQVLRKPLLPRRGEKRIHVVPASHVVADRLKGPRRRRQRHRICQRRNAEWPGACDRLLGVPDCLLRITEMRQRVGEIRRRGDVRRGRDREVRQVAVTFATKLERSREAVPRRIEAPLVKGQDAKPDMPGDRYRRDSESLRQARADRR